MAFEKLFEPIMIGKVKIKNRYAVAPMNWMYNDWTGLVNEEEIAYAVARAKGGVGLFNFGAILSTKFGVPFMPHPWVYCWDIAHVPGLAMVAEAIRLGGASPFIQLLPVPSHRGHAWTGTEPVAPSAGEYQPMVRETVRKIYGERLKGPWIPSNMGVGNPPYPPAREVTRDEIETIIKENAFACKLAVYAGFEGIELHECHHYFISLFRDAGYNKRTDKYGGSVDRRNRILIELTDAAVRAAKEERPDIAVGVRVDCEMPDGFTFEETLRLAPQLEELGIDFWHATFGGMHMTPEKRDKDGVMAEYAMNLKKVLKIPVITYGFHDPTVAEKAVTEGAVDMVSICRPLIADPQYVNKVKENRVKDIVKCTKCNFCWLCQNLSLPGRCGVNPEVGFEKNNPEYRFTQGFKGVHMFPHVLRRLAK